MFNIKTAVIHFVEDPKIEAFVPCQLARHSMMIATSHKLGICLLQMFIIAEQYPVQHTHTQNSLCNITVKCRPVAFLVSFSSQEKGGKKGRQGLNPDHHLGT